jgi:uncharacterized protein
MNTILMTAIPVTADQPKRLHQQLKTLNGPIQSSECFCGHFIVTILENEMMRTRKRANILINKPMNLQKLFLTGLWLVAAIGSSSVLAAGFDCAQSSTLIEKQICENSELSGLDAQLSVVFRKVSAQCPGKILKTDQLRWLQQVRNRCSDTDCLARVYQKRLRELKNWQCGEQVCHEYAHQLPGAWKSASDTAPFEVIAFSQSGAQGQGRFDTWLHERPEFSDGRWLLEACYLRLIYPGEPGNGMMDNFVLKSITASTLEMLDAEGQTVFYRRLSR